MARQRHSPVNHRTDSAARPLHHSPHPEKKHRETLQIPVPDPAEQAIPIRFVCRRPSHPQNAANSDPKARETPHITPPPGRSRPIRKKVSRNATGPKKFPQLLNNSYF